MPVTLLYKRALAAGRHLPAMLVFAVVAGLFTPSEVSAAGEFRARGVVLPGGAVRVSDDRFRLPDSYNASLKFYRSIYRPERYTRKAIVNQPGVRAVHVTNPDPSGEWEGFNLYEYQGEVRVFILARKR